MKRKLKLEIKNDDNEVRVTHHFYYDARDEEKMTLTVDQRVFNLKPNGTLISDAEKQNKK